VLKYMQVDPKILKSDVERVMLGRKFKLQEKEKGQLVGGDYTARMSVREEAVIACVLKVCLRSKRFARHTCNSDEFLKAHASQEVCMKAFSEFASTIESTLEINSGGSISSRLRFVLELTSPALGIALGSDAQENLFEPEER